MILSSWFYISDFIFFHPPWIAGTPCVHKSGFRSIIEVFILVLRCRKGFKTFSGPTSIIAVIFIITIISLPSFKISVHPVLDFCGCCFFRMTLPYFTLLLEAISEFLHFVNFLNFDTESGCFVTRRFCMRGSILTRISSTFCFCVSPSCNLLIDSSFRIINFQIILVVLLYVSIKIPFPHSNGFLGGEC